MTIISHDGKTTSIVGHYATRLGMLSTIDIVAKNDTFYDMKSGRSALTPEGLLPLAVRDSGWDVVVDGERHA
jgi:hypothetical protein